MNEIKVDKIGVLKEIYKDTVSWVKGLPKGYSRNLILCPEMEPNGGYLEGVGRYDTIKYGLSTALINIGVGMSGGYKLSNGDPKLAMAGGCFGLAHGVFLVLFGEDIRGYVDEKGGG